MKRQTLLMTAIFSGILLILLFVTLSIRLHAHWVQAPSNQQSVSLGAFSMVVPKGFGSGHPLKDERWDAREFRGGSLGILKLGTQQSDGTPWEILCANWFELPAYPKGGLRFEKAGSKWYFREVPLFGRSAYLLNARGKQVRFIAFFEQDKTRYWIELDSREGFIHQKELFDAILQSLARSDGARPGPELAGALRSAASDARFHLLQPVEIIMAIPLAAMLLIAVIQIMVRKRAGRLPEGISAFDPHCVFIEAGAEMCFVRPFQRKFMDCALAVSAEELTLYTFGTPFLLASTKNGKPRISLGKAWLGTPYVDLTLDQPPVFKKWSMLYRWLRMPVTLRLYTKEAERLRAILARE
jgi:hypothetical protein